jgi:hypothetical protein
MIRWARWWASVVALGLTLCLAQKAYAASRVLLLEFSGRKGDVLREKVAQSLEDGGYTVVLGTSTSQGASKADLARLAKSAKADVLVAGRVRRHSMRSWSVTLTVHDADGGGRVGKDVRFKNSWLPGLSKELVDLSSKKLNASIKRAGPSSASRGAADESEDEPSEPEAPAEPMSSEEPSAAEVVAAVEAGGEDDLFEVDPSVIADDGPDAKAGSESSGISGGIGVRAGIVHRSLDFSDDIYQRLRTQTANIWVYQVAAEVYPFEQPVGDKLGIIASYQGVFSGNVKDSDFGGSFPVVFSELFGGLRGRYPVGQHRVGLDLTFGQMRSGLDDPEKRADIPEITYTVLRTSLDVDLDLGVVRALASAGFRLPLGYGQASTADWFPRIGGYGIEVSGGLEYPFSKHVSLAVTGELRRYLLEMNSEPEDARVGVAEVAGGAVDLYSALYFGMAFRL